MGEGGSIKSFSPIPSYQKLLGQLTDAGNTTTLAHYQRLIESAFLILGLPKWSGGALRRRSSSPKWLPLNTALMTALANKGFYEWRNNPNIWGRLVEVAVGAYLVNEAIRYGFKVYYWRQGNYEVNFIILKGEKIMAVEVKSGKNRMSLPGLNLFQKSYKTHKVITLGVPGFEIGGFLQMPIIEWFN